MVTLSTNVIVLFAASCIFAFFFPFFKDGLLKKLSLKELIPGLRFLGILTIGPLILLSLAVQMGLLSWVALVAFLSAVALSYMLAQVGLPPLLRGILLLVCSVALTTHSSGDGVVITLAAALLGLLVFKLAENFCLAKTPSFDDILPSLCWLSAVMWNRSSSPESLMSMRESIALSAIAIAQVMRVVQRPFLNDDKWFLKRLILSATAGLLLLIVMTKLLFVVPFGALALLFGGSVLAAYVFVPFPSKDEREERQQKEMVEVSDANGSNAIMALVIIGIITLVTMRFFGIFGLVVLAPSALVAPATGMAQLLGMYAAMRALLQVFIATFNSNVTGINIMHPYSSAGQYAGFALVIALFVALQQIQKPAKLAATFIGLGIAMPAISNYFFHAEPTSSLLLSITVSASIMAIFAPALRKADVSGFENFMMLPFVAIVSALLTGGLIQTGNLVTNAGKVTTLEELIGVFAVVALGFWAIERCRPRQPLEGSAK